MTKDIVSVSDDQTVAMVAGIMREKRVMSVIVNSKGKPSGICTERGPPLKILCSGQIP